MKSCFRITVLTAALLLVPGAGSAGAVRVVPPGNSGANQYTETLPGPGGNVPSDEVKGGSPDKVLGAANAARLKALGPEGRAAAELAAATAPGKTGRVAPPDSAAPASSGSSGIGEVLEQATGTSGSGGMGLLLPLLIVLASIGSLAFFLARRRPRQSHG